MDAALQELSKLEKLTSNAKTKTPSIQDTLDSLLQSLRSERDNIEIGTSTPDSIQAIVSKVESAKKDIDDRQKEIYNSLARFGKALDKVRDGIQPRCYYYRD
jgi:DNA repair ATPase RecN